MNDKEQKTLFTILDEQLEDTVVSWSGGERFNSKENINKIIEEIEKHFTISLKQ